MGSSFTDRITQSIRHLKNRKQFGGGGRIDRPERASQIIPHSNALQMAWHGMHIKTRKIRCDRLAASPIRVFSLGLLLGYFSLLLNKRQNKQTEMDNKRGCPSWPGSSIRSEIAAVSFNLAFPDAQVSDRRCYFFRLHPAAFPFYFVFLLFK